MKAGKRIHFTLLCSFVLLVRVVNAQTILENIRLNAEISEDHNETTIAINPTDPDNLLAGSHYWTYEGPGSVKQLAAYYSTDRGFAWGESFLPYGGSYDKTADPVVAFAANGTAYYAHISYDGEPSYGCFPPNGYDDNSLFVNRSTNGGQTWLSNPFVVVQNGNGTSPPGLRFQHEDKPWIAADALPTSPFTNNVYVSWTRFYCGATQQILFSRSEAGSGGVFDTPIALSGTGNFAQGSAVAVGPGGIIYVAWIEANPTTIKIVSSTDGGTTFSSAQTVVTGIVSGTFYISGHRGNSFPALAVDATGGEADGHVYLSWTDKRNGNPDVFFIEGEPTQGGGINWNQMVLVHEPSSVDQWFPGITVDPKGAVHVVYYDKRNHGAGDMADVFVAFKIPGGSFASGVVNTASFDVSIESHGFMGDYISIASDRYRVYPFWTDMRDGRQDVYLGVIDQESTVYLTLNQLLDGDPHGLIGRWEENQFIYYDPGEQVATVIDEDVVVKGSQDIAGTPPWKYNRWNAFPDLRNHQEIMVDGTFATLTSNFRPTSGGVMIKTNLLDAPGLSAGPLRFKDPWLIDLADEEYGNSLKNQGAEAPFKTRSSPFNPNTNPTGPGSEYKGVFLGETDPTAGQYAVEAISPNSIPGLVTYFRNWLGSDADIQDELSQQTAVVFLDGDAIVTADYKGHLASSSSEVTARNSTRRTIRDIEERYHMVYESAGSIWYTRSTNGGQTWSPEAVVYEQAEDYTFRDPSITVQQNPYVIAVTCEIVYALTSEINIALTLIDPPTGTMTPADQDVGYVDGIVPTLPVVASAVDNAGGGGTNYLLFVWYDPNGPSMKGRIRRGDGVWFGEGVLKNAVVSQISVAPISAQVGDKWHVVWKEGENLYYSQIDVNGAPPSLESPNFVLADGSAAEIQLDNPSVVRLFKSQGNPAVSWEEYNSELAKRRIKFRECLGNDPPTWTNVTVWTGSQNSQFYNPSLSGQHNVTDAFLAWRYGTSLKFVQRIGMTWTSTSNLATGYDPMLAVGWDQVTQELAAYRKVITQPYEIGITGVPPTPPPFARGGNPRAEMPTGRGGRVFYEGGMMHLVVLEATLDGESIPFVALSDTLPARTPGEFSEALKTEPFSGTGTLSLQVQYSASGTLPPEAFYRATIRDAETDQLLSTVRVFLGVEDTIMTVTIPLAFRNRSVRLVLQPTELSSARSLEVEQWFIVDEGDTTGATISAPVSASATAPEGIPQAFVLHQNYPNPFNPQTSIRYEIPQGAHVTLRVYDVLGKELLTLVDETQPAGYHETIVDGTDLASGVYVYRLTAGNFTDIRKMVLIK